jgi:hypothetical protein
MISLDFLLLKTPKKLLLVTPSKTGGSEKVAVSQSGTPACHRQALNNSLKTKNPDRFQKLIRINYLKSKSFLFVAFHRFAGATQVAVAKGIVNTANRWSVKRVRVSLKVKPSLKPLG